MLKEIANRDAGYLKDLALSHACASHPFFTRMRKAEELPITPLQAVAVLSNYDAHASLLRRLLLKAAAYMPEAAVGFVVENVRNEYGNGDYALCHQGQLRDVIDRVRLIGNLREQSQVLSLSKGVKTYIARIGRYYHPKSVGKINGFYGPAITAGAITATELMAIEEFRAMQIAFKKFELDLHPWFDHVNVECDHGEESLALAEYFIKNFDAADAVDYGFKHTLATNVHLYDGLLEAITANEDN